MMRFAFLIISLSPLAVFAVEKNIEKTSHTDIAKLSEAFGHLIAKSLNSNGLNYDVAKVLEGLQNSVKGAESPMTEQEYFEAIATIEEDRFKQLSNTNLQEAEKFLNENKTAPNIQVLENGKIQFKIDQEGAGTEIVQENSTPLIRYVGKFLDGHVFDSTTKEIPLNLEDTIEGFHKGLVGMREGEKRVIYIHPACGYGTAFRTAPNRLLTFEVEIIKANAVLQKEEQHTNPEIAHPLEEHTVTH